MIAKLKILLPLPITAIFAFLISGLIQAQSSNLRFEHFSLQEGLSQTTVSCILQDSQGFMWFGTEDGLNKYDGYDFKIYRSVPGNTQSLKGSNISSLIEGPSGNLWIGTDKGLTSFDPTLEKFTSLEFGESSDTQWVTGLTIDSKHNMWIGTSNGLWSYNLKTGKFSHYPIGDGSQKEGNHILSVAIGSSGNIWLGTTFGPFSFDPSKSTFTSLIDMLDLPFVKRNISVQSILEDSLGTLWIGARNGLYEVDLKTGKTHVVQFYPNEDIKPRRWGSSKNTIISIYAGAKDILWLGTYGGLVKYNTKDHSSSIFVSKPGDQFSLNANKIASIYEDRNGILWVGTFSGGINKYDPKRWLFDHYKHNPLNANSLSNNSVRAIAEDREQLLWIGTMNGLSRQNQKTGEVTRFYSQKDDANSISSNVIRSLLLTSNGELLVGTWDAGLSRYNAIDNEFVRYKAISNDSLGAAQVTSMAEDSLGDIWMGIGTGLKLDRKTDSFTQFLSDQKPTELYKNRIMSIYFNSHNELWMGTQEDGLLRKNHDSEEFTRYIQDPTDANSLSHNYVTAMVEGPKDILWIGTYGGGLNKLNTKTDTFKHYNTSNGLPNDVIYGLLKDSRGHLWISSNKGICRFDPVNETFTTYGVEDGLQSNEFNAGAFYKNKEGKMFFGGINGINVFHPDSIFASQRHSEVVFTDFQIFNKPMAIGKDLPLKRSISEVQEITLNHDQSVFSFEFTALNYTNPNKNQYAYMLEGFDSDWQQLGNRNFVTFTNIDPGNYSLKIKATNGHGIWNENVKQLGLVIMPPWWSTWWAYVCYVLLTLFLLYWWRRNLIRRTQLSAKYEIEHLEHEKIKELDKMKSVFFENISHEIRTPLTLILGPLESMKQHKVPVEVETSLKTVLDNSRRLEKLVNEFLDISKLEAGRLKLELRFQDLVPILKSVVSLFKNNENRKEVSIEFQTQMESLWFSFDKDKVEKIISNILSNAIKFTAKGTIFIKVMEEKKAAMHFAKIQISDNGPGIPKKLQSRIFERFFQTDVGESHSGTGIGLALAKQLTELHNGRIQVDSKDGLGATFSVFLPIESEIKAKSILKNNKHNPEIGYPGDIPDYKNKTLTGQNGESIKILVIEDHQPIRTYLNSILSNDYEVLLAGDGDEGLNLAIEQVPDIIISDVLMPKIGGYELCKKLKTDRRTSHIPIILLTAKSDIKSKLEGLDLGADDYLTKPFYKDELLLLLRNRLQRRELLREQFSELVYLKPSNLPISSSEHDFLNSVMKIIEGEMENPDFRVENFAQEIGMSRTQLYRKLKALTGKSAGAFVKQVRLQRALQFLIESNTTISEIAYAIGYQQSSSFITDFKKHHHLTPLQYRKKHQSRP